MLTQLLLVKERALYRKIALLVVTYQIDYRDKEVVEDQWHNKPQTHLKKIRYLLLVLNQGIVDRWIPREEREILWAQENSAKTIQMAKASKNMKVDWTTQPFQHMIFLHRMYQRVRRIWTDSIKLPTI